MKALVYINKETLSYREETNLIPNSDENLIRVNASGICGSDMHAYHGLDERRVPPLILGHEISGFDTSNKSPVVINPLITCKKCENCLIGREHICINRGLLGMSKPIKRNGGFAEYVKVPKKNILEVPKISNLQHLALTEPTAVAYHAIKILEKASFIPIQKSKILIIGGGAIGLLISLILQLKESKNITIIDTNKRRLNVCQKASNCLISHPDDIKIKNNDYDIVFDAVGFSITRKKSILSVKQGGTIIHIGLSEPAGDFDFRKTTLQEITFIGTYCYTNKDFRSSLDMLIKKKLGDLSWLDLRPLKDGASAFREIHNNTTSSPKIILLP